MVNPLRIPAWVQQVNTFQRLAILNKAVLDVAGMDVPIIALAKNNDERKERLFRQALILVGTFLLAPLHAALVYRLFGQSLPDKRLLQLPYKNLLSVRALKEGTVTLYRQTLKSPLPKRLMPRLNEAFRKRLIRAKTGFLITDLMLMGVLLSNVGWLKNLFGRALSGNKQFSGERGIVGQQQLDRLYAAEAQGPHVSEQFKMALTSILGGAVPLGIGLLLRHALTHPTSAGGGLFKLARAWSPRFDYQFKWGVPWLANLSLAAITLCSDVAEVAASRSPRELRENLLIRPIGFVS
ncbi:MAG: hypothetical protein KC475_11295, partial [Cyanobacteria bacterium HKST-UBA03]|nr:hypothetical protein [Cyanobacteria bacterium HKST-UBA03]